MKELKKFIVVSDKDLEKIIKKKDIKSLAIKEVTHDIEQSKSDSDSSFMDKDLINKILELEKLTLEILQDVKTTKCCPSLKSFLNGNKLSLK